MINKPLTEIEANFERNCFACSPKNPIGLKLKFLTDGKKLHTRFYPEVLHSGWGEILHGGIAATLVDETSAWCVIALCKTMCVTQNLNLSFHRPILVKREICIMAEIVHRSDKRIHTRAEIYNDDDVLCLSAEGVFVPIDTKKAKRLKIMTDAEIAEFQSLLSHISV